MGWIWTGIIFGLGIFIIAGAAVILVAYLRDLGAARRRLVGLGGQVVHTACGLTEFARVGDGDPVLVVHGAMGGFDQGLWLAHSFEITRRQVLAVSRFGYLGTPVSSGADLDLQADAFAAFFDSLGIEKAAVVAVSAGSTSAIRFTARHPDRITALVLICPDAPGDTQMPMPPRSVFDRLLRSDFVYWGLVTFFGGWMQGAIGLVPKRLMLSREQKAMVSRIQKGDLPVSRRMDGLIFETYTCAEEFNASASPQARYPLADIRTPILVIHAEDDPISTPKNVRAMTEQFPNACRFSVPDGGHFLFGHTEEVRAEIARFLQQNAAGAVPSRIPAQ